jgi:hypothetical protein
MIRKQFIVFPAVAPLSRDPIGVCNLRESLPVGSWVKRHAALLNSYEVAWPNLSPDPRAIGKYTPLLSWIWGQVRLPSSKELTYPNLARKNYERKKLQASSSKLQA